MADNKHFVRLYEKAQAKWQEALARFEADKTDANHAALLEAHRERLTAWETIPYAERGGLVEQARVGLFSEERTT